MFKINHSLMILLLLQLSLTLPGYAAETITFPLQEKLPANVQQIEPSEPEQEEASEETEEEPGFFETTKGKVTAAVAILASSALGTGLYFYLKKMREKEKKAKEQQEKQRIEQINLRYKDQIPPLSKPVREVLKNLIDDPELIKSVEECPSIYFIIKDLRGKRFFLLNSGNYIIITDEHLQRVNKKLKKIRKIIFSTMKKSDYFTESFGLGIDKKTGNLMLMKKHKTNPLKWITIPNFGSDERMRTKFPEAVQIFDIINDLNKNFHPKATLTEKSPYQDIGFIFPD